jgi:NADH dehydrogenase
MILIAGSTGRVGGMITRELLAQGDDVRILVRPGSDFRPHVDAGATPVIGDLKDPATLEAACRGVDVIISTASAGERGGDDTPDTVDNGGTRALVDAARAAGVRQFIFVSTLAADENSPAPLPRAKATAERYLRESGVPYTILAANGIMDVNFPLVVGARLSAGRPVTLVGEARRRHSYVAARDLAAFAVAAVEHPAALNRRVIICGPQALTWHDVIHSYERALERSIPVESVPPGTLLPDLPPVPGLAELVSGLLALLETFDSPIDMTETAETFGVQLTSVDEFARGQPDPMLAARRATPA